MTTTNRDPRLVELLGKVRAMARSIASRTRSKVGVDDLISAGNLGVATALSRHDGAPFAALEGYCLAHARGAMYDELRRRDTLSRTDRRRARKVATAVRVLQHRLGREPDEREIVAEIELDVMTYRRLRAQMEYRTVSADTIDAATEPCAPLVEASHSAEQALQERQRMAIVSRFLREAKECLPPRQADTIALSFDAEQPSTFVSETLGVSQGRVSQIRKAALLRLREMASANRAFRQEAFG